MDCSSQRARDQGSRLEPLTSRFNFFAHVLSASPMDATGASPIARPVRKLVSEHEGANELG